MKHLIETADPSGLPSVLYDRIILNNTTDDIIVRGGGANILMFSETGYRLLDDITYEYTGTEAYNGKEYFKYSLSETNYILAPTRNITKVTFPFDNYYCCFEGKILPFSESGLDNLYGFTSVPENKVVMKRRTDIGTNANGKAYVDLGLTSGTLWATMNVGATSETDYGSYFQWGDTEDKRDADCSWSTYKYCNGSENTLTKYCTNSSYGTVDNKLTLDLEDDAARANMGGDWKMPSVALIEELVSETNSEWITNYKNSGINGRKFTGPNGNSIFIPASGLRSGSSFFSQGDDGYIWITLVQKYDSNGLAYCLNFDSDSISATNHTNDRCYGLTVRGVL